MEDRIYGLMGQREERHWWFRGRRAVIGSLLARAALPPGIQILDAGCGTGGNFGLYSGYGAVSGVEYSADAVEHCRRRGIPNVTQGDAQELPYEGDRFQLVASTDVLEHVPDDLRALQEMRRVAASSATLLITVPAYQWLWTDEDERLGHFRRYTLAGLRRTAAAAGWKPVFGTYFNSILLAPIAIARQLPRRRPATPELERTPAALDGPLSVPMRVEAQLIRRGISLPAGVSVALLCSA